MGTVIMHNVVSVDGLHRRRERRRRATPRVVLQRGHPDHRRRYFGSIEGQHLLEDPHVVIQGDRVLHLRFKVRRYTRSRAASSSGAHLFRPVFSVRR